MDRWTLNGFTRAHGRLRLSRITPPTGHSQEEVELARVGDGVNQLKQVRCV